MPTPKTYPTLLRPVTPLWLALLCVLSACQSAPPAPPRPPAPKMPACLLEPIPSQSMLTLLTQAMDRFETGSSSMPPVPARGAEQMRLCLLDVREAWPK